MNHTRISSSIGKRHNNYYIIYYQKPKIKYCSYFPIEWAMKDSFIEIHNRCKNNPYMGSVCCENCKKYGTINGLFTQYCLNCVNSSERPGCECNLKKMLPNEKVLINGKYAKIYGYPCKSKKCIFNTYLKNVDLSFLLPNNI